MFTNIKKFADICTVCVNNGVLKTVVFHSPSDKSSECLKVRGKLKNISSEIVLQLEYCLTEGRVTHKNIAKLDITEELCTLAETFRKADLTTINGRASLMISKKGDKATVLCHGDVTSGDSLDVEKNNRQKRHILSGNETFLEKLGISDGQGRVRDKMQAKFRQINRFCEYIIEAAGHFCDDGTVYVADLCCGKSYLSFAAYHTITEVLGKKCIMYCVDLKKSVIDYCRGIAEKCEFDGMEFTVSDINEFTPPVSPNLVISLHACDVATDIVLECAIRCRAKVILSTPCCHHEMNEKLDCETLSFIAMRPILRQKLCTAATDALRLMRLDAAGYETDATELIDPEDTPKNVMLRGYLKKNFTDAKKMSLFDEYAVAYRFMYGTEPKALP